MTERRLVAKVFASEDFLEATAAELAKRSRDN